MNLSFPKCLRLVTCVPHQPVSRGGVWLTRFLSDNTLGYSLRGG